MEQGRPHQNDPQLDITNSRGVYEGVIIDLSIVPRLQLPILPNPRQFYFLEIPVPNLPAVDLRQLGVELRDTTPERSNAHTEDNS